jgi:hypothetical protein
MPSSRSILSPAAERRVQVGLAVQPFVAAALNFVLFPALEYTHAGRTVNALGAAIGVSLYVGIAAVIITAFAAYPLLCWLLTRVRLTAMHAVTAGIALGNIPAAISILLVTFSTLNRTGALPAAGTLLSGSSRGVAFGSLIGAGSAFVFWQIAGRAVRQAQERAGLWDMARH